MERSFGSKYGKWIALTAVVLALVPELRIPEISFKMFSDFSE